MVMTNEEILEGNKLIAEFMEEKINSSGNHINIAKDHYMFKRVGSICGMYSHSDCYSSSFEWLMPVFEKIQEIDDNQEEYLNGYYDINFEINLTSGVDFKINRKRIFMQTAYGKGQLIEALWSGVIEFIKWYNQNKQDE